MALGYFFALLFLVGVGLAIGQGVANTLFLKRFGVQYLPQIFLAQGLGLSFASLFYATFSDRVRPEKVMVVVLAIMVALLLVFWVLSYTPWANWGHPPLYLLQIIASEILALHFTLYVGSHFDAEQSKRLMPLAMAGGQLGEVSGGLLLAVGAPVVGAANMIMVWLVTAAAAWMLVLAWHRRHGATRASNGVRRGGSRLKQIMYQMRQGLGFARESKLLRSSLLAIFYTIIALVMLSYLIKEAFVREFQREEDLAMVFGMITFVGGSISFLVQTMVTPRLVSRFGVRAVNLSFPLTTLFAVVAFLTPWTLVAAFVAAANRRILLPSIRNPVRSLMWQALPDYMQGRARGLSLAIVAPSGMLLAGLLVEGLRGQPGGIAGLGVAVALLAWHFSRRSNRAYMDAIVNTIKERLFVPRDDLAKLSPSRDSRFLAELTEGLESADETLAEGFARMLAEHFGEMAVPAVLRRMDRASQPCRDRLAQLISPHVTEEHADAWLLRLKGSDAHGQATILGVAFRLRWKSAAKHISACLGSDNPRLVACGIMGGFAYDDDKLRVAAERQLQRVMHSTNVSELTVAMEMATALPRPEFRPLVCQVLQQESSRLLTHALRALDALGQTIAEPNVAQRVAQIYRDGAAWELRAASVSVMGLLPLPARVDSLIDAMDDPQPQVQKVAVDLLAAQGAAWVAEPLLEALRGWRLGIRGQTAALTVLSDMLSADRMREVALGYLEVACNYADALPTVDVSSSPGELFAIVLTERVGQLADLGLRALAFGPDRSTVEIVRAAVASDDRRQRMRCLDLLEDYRDPAVRELMGRLLRSRPDAGVKPDSGRHSTVPTADGDGWLSLVARQWSAA